MSREDRQAVRELFLVGGSSFNSAILNQPEKSRRIELRLEFRDAGGQCEPGHLGCEPRSQTVAWEDDLKCPVNSR
jgi:hypothetical protein